MSEKKSIDYKQYGNKWIAVSKNREEVFASSSKVEVVYKKAKKQSKDFVIVNASAHSGSFIL